MYYVYGLFYEEDEEQVCFYIGSGTGNRSEQHFFESRLQETENKHKERKIRKLRKEGKEPYDKILVGNLEQEQARQLERKLLEKDKIFESVTNLTRNVFGFPEGEDHPLYGKSLSEEHKRKISESLKGIQFSEKRKQAISEAKSGNDNTTEEQRKILSEVHSGKEIEDWHRKRIAEANRNKEVSEETRKKLAEVNKGERSPSSKITSKEAAEIRWLCENSDQSQKEIGNKYGIGQATVSGISRGKNWTHVGSKKPY
jgi:hypothetical protein